MNPRLRWIGFLSVAALLVICVIGAERTAESVWAEIYKSAWAGIYTNDQAARGESAYRERCASCHGAMLEGSDAAPPLAGRDFRDDFDEMNMADLFEKIQYTMPANRPAGLTEQQSADIVSYILKFNGFPAGSSGLPATVDDLRGVRFLAENPARQN
jgi:S-disulfanyl-L-cysteine oxidoreductase SoxD